ncbi:MAG: hypothetical protein ABI543_15300 [Ignavibacteria bacterium]
MNNASVTAKKYFASSNIKSIQFVSAQFARKYKIIVFVPLKNADEITFKMASAGAGNIGKYSVCSFRTKGVGTFIGGKDSIPAVGKKGRFEMTEEVRLEMICEQNDIDSVVNTVYENHPYEEPVCEIYPVIVRDTKLNKETALVHLKRSVKVKDLLKKVKPALNSSELPAKLLNTSVARAFIDLSGGTAYNISPAKTKTIVIKKNKNIINFEVI